MCDKIIYYINSSEIPGELSRKNMICYDMLFSHVKLSTLLWLHKNIAPFASKLKRFAIHWCLLFIAAWRYEISLLLLKNIPLVRRSLRSLVKYCSTLKEKFRISARPCNILYSLLQNVQKRQSVPRSHFLNGHANSSVQLVDVRKLMCATQVTKGCQKLKDKNVHKKQKTKT